ncbi:MAG: hypothetical protein M3Y56_14250 [Armatimonadota bacterium]|nr:hypothetical protein [Armatimonadota bacterium]
MNENPMNHPDTPAMTRRATAGWQKVVIAVTGIMALALLIVAVGALQSRNDTIASSLQVTQNDLKADEKSGKLVWTGAITNRGAAAAEAPWIKVTIYNPAGQSVDTGDAIAEASSIPAGGQLSYTSTFDTRGLNLRSIPVMIVPNSQPLGM